MTPAELQAEWTYRYEERLGMLCGSAEPTERQKWIAKIEADRAVDSLRKANGVDSATNE